MLWLKMLTQLLFIFIWEFLYSIFMHLSLLCKVYPLQIVVGFFKETIKKAEREPCWVRPEAYFSQPPISHSSQLWFSGEDTQAKGEGSSPPPPPRLPSNWSSETYFAIWMPKCLWWTMNLFNCLLIPSKPLVVITSCGSEVHKLTQCIE